MNANILVFFFQRWIDVLGVSLWQLLSGTLVKLVQNIFDFFTKLYAFIGIRWSWLESLHVFSTKKNINHDDFVRKTAGTGKFP